MLRYENLLWACFIAAGLLLFCHLSAIGVFLAYGEYLMAAISVACSGACAYVIKQTVHAL